MIEYAEKITRHMVKSNPNKIFVFGDNDKRMGFGGQAAEMRGEPNSVGIRVKKSPSMTPDSFYYDSEISDNIKKIYNDLQNLYIASNGLQKTIVFPASGIGTGRAMLYKTAPMTFARLNAALLTYFKINNEKSHTQEREPFETRKKHTSNKNVKRCKCQH